MTPEGAVMLQAWVLGRKAHAGQTDKAGQDYFTAHVADVAFRLDPEGADPVGRTVAYLHDVVEDTAWTLEALASAGFPGEVVAAVDAITHRPNEPRAEYYARVKANPLALRVKLADIASNTDPDRMALLDEKTWRRLTTKYAYALETLS